MHVVAGEDGEEGLGADQSTRAEPFTGALCPCRCSCVPACGARWQHRPHPLGRGTVGKRPFEGVPDVLIGAAAATRRRKAMTVPGQTADVLGHSSARSQSVFGLLSSTPAVTRK